MRPLLILPLLAALGVARTLPGHLIYEHGKASSRSVRNNGDDPEVNMTAPELMQQWGYPVEVAQATTDDGYVLEIHRIPWGRSGPAPGNPCRPVVFMQHGTMGDSSHWTTNLPEQSAGFIFADAGFDVWLGNVRGTTYSKHHTTLDPASEKFWEFSWDEYALKDLETMVDHVLAATGQKSLYYIGHSQGTLIMFSKLSEDPSFAPKIRKFFALAPIAQVKHIKGLLAFLANTLADFVDVWYEIFGSGEFMGYSPLIAEIAEQICKPAANGDDVCDDLLFLIAGPESNQWNETRVPVYVSHADGGTSTQNMIHLAQMVLSGTVSKFDFQDAKKNQQHYGTQKPPKYDFAKIKTDMYLYWSDDDWLSDPKDLKEFLFTVLNPTYLKQNNQLTGFNHLDFIWGLNATREIYLPILEVVKGDLGGSVKCPA